jgi:hypothetical protein
VSGCNIQCYKFRLNVENFPAGTYTIGCFEDGHLMSGTSPNSYSVPANGSIDLSCWYGYPGHTVAADIHGWGMSESYVWP